MGLLLLTACASGSALKVRPGAAPRPASAVAVYPFQFRWSEPAYRSFQLGTRLALQVQETGRYAVFGPGEFTVRDPRSEAVFVVTDLATVVSTEGVPAAGLLVLRGWAEKREQSSSHRVEDAAGHPAGEAAGAEVTVVVHLELLDPSAGEVLAEVEGSAHSTHSDEASDDPSPELSALALKLATQLLGAMESLAPGESVRRAAWGELVWSPAPLFAFSDRGRPALEAELAGLDQPARQAARARAVRYFAPTAPPETQAVAAAQAGGLWVQAPSAAAYAAGLRAGDVLVQVGSVPATPLSVNRALRLAPPGEAVAARVQRQGAEVALQLPAGP